MKINEVLTESRLGNAAETAQRMYDKYAGLNYTAYDRAVDHSQNYESNTPQYQYWIDVAREIDRLERADTAKKKKSNLEEARVRYEDIVLDYSIDGANVDVRAIVDGKQVAYVVFLRDGKLLIPDDLAVDEEYRGRGIAKKMYDWVKSLPQGFRIIRSGIQTNMGKRFWDKNRGENVDVWEEEMAEGSLNEFAISGDDDSGSQRPMSLADVAKIIKAKLGPDWTMEHVGRTEQPGYKFIPTDKTKHGMAKIWCLVDWDKVGEYPTYNTILYSFQNENGRIIANGRHTEKAKPKTVSNALVTAQSILENTDGALKNSMAEDTVDEMALASYKTLGDFSKPGSFRGVDKRLVPHPKSELKAAKFFEQTPYDFRLFFANKSGLGQYQEYGPISPEEIVKVFGEEDAKTILDNHDDAITVVYVSNRGAEKVMMTPWIMAHRFGHAIQAGARNEKWSAWMETEKLFFSTVNRLLDEYYGKMYRGPNTYSSEIKWDMAPEYNALFNAIGTQRSSRTGQIRRPYEFMYEMFAQYLGTGTITLNPLPTNLRYGRKVFGNPSKYLNIKPEFRDETERRQISEMLARDMELMFNDVLGNSVGKIFVM